jgi:hypothetical protein
MSFFKFFWSVEKPDANPAKGDCHTGYADAHKPPAATASAATSPIICG